MSPACDKSDPEYCKHAHAAAKSAVKQTFAILGVDVDNPAQVEEFRKSLRFVDSLSKATDRGITAIFVLIAVALAGCLYAGIKISLLGGG